MADPRTRIMRLITAAQIDLLRKENGIIRQIHAAYGQARKEMLAELTEAYQRLGPDPKPETVRRLLGDRSLVLAIERRMGRVGTGIWRTFVRTA